MRRCLSMIMLPSLMFSLGGSDARAQALPVFVAAVNEAPPPAKPRDLAAAADAAERHMRTVRDAVYKEHGYKRAAWPAQVVDAVNTVENAAQLARARLLYQPDATRDGLQETVEDLVREMGNSKSGQIAAVTTRDNAALILEVVGRRRRAMNLSSPTDNRYFIRFRLRSGPAMNDQRFREAGASYVWGPDMLTKAFARPTTEIAHWDAEVGSMASFKGAAMGAVRAVLESFVTSVAASAPR